MAWLAAASLSASIGGSERAWAAPASPRHSNKVVRPARRRIERCPFMVVRYSSGCERKAVPRASRTGNRRIVCERGNGVQFTFGKAHADRQSASVRAVGQFHRGAMRVRDPLDDRKAQATAGRGVGRVRAGSPVEPLEHALAVLGRDAGTRIDDAEHRRTGLVGHGDVDAAALGRVAQRVVEEVRQQHRERRGVALHGHVGRPREAEIDALVGGQRGTRDDRVAHERRQVDRGERPRRGFGLEPRHGQQLVDQMGRAIHALLQFRERGRTGRRVGRARGEFDLQLERREWRAQFVRGIGGEAALGGERLVEPREQRVEAPRQRLQFARQRAFGERRQRIRPALGHGARHCVERLQAATDGVPDQHAEERDQCRQRQQRAQRGLRGDFAPLVQRMRDLQCVRAFDVRVDAPLAAIARDGRIAFGGGNRQARFRLRPVDQHAVAVPDLRDDLGHAGCAATLGRPQRRLPAAQQVVDPRRVRELLQLQVEELADFALGLDVGERRREHGDRRQSGQQPG